MGWELIDIIRLQPGQAIILQFNTKHKIIFRKEYDGMFYFVHPTKLHKLSFNSVGTYILISLLNGISKEEIIVNLDRYKRSSSTETENEVETFVDYLNNLHLINYTHY